MFQAALSTSTGFVDTRSVPMVGSGAVKLIFFLLSAVAPFFHRKRAGGCLQRYVEANGVKKEISRTKMLPSRQ